MVITCRELSKREEKEKRWFFIHAVLKRYFSNQQTSSSWKYLEIDTRKKCIRILKSWMFQHANEIYWFSKAKRQLTMRIAAALLCVYGAWWIQFSSTNTITITSWYLFLKLHDYWTLCDSSALIDIFFRSMEMRYQKRRPDN